MPPLVREGGGLVCESVGKADLLSDHFDSKQSREAVDLPLTSRVTKAKFLGVIVDQYQNWKDHISMVPHKISKSCGIISRIRNTLDIKSEKIIYYSLTQPYLTYCINVSS